MMILGINAYHGDVSAALLRDGELIAAVEEERFRRIKHWAGFPRDAIRACLEIANVASEKIDHFAISRNPRAHFWRKALFALWNRPRLGLVADRLRNPRSTFCRAARLEEWAAKLRRESNQGAGEGASRPRCSRQPPRS